MFLRKSMGYGGGHFAALLWELKPFLYHKEGASVAQSVLSSIFNSVGPKPEQLTMDLFRYRTLVKYQRLVSCSQ